jgi:hypothetical protein
VWGATAPRLAQAETAKGWRGEYYRQRIAAFGQEAQVKIQLSNGDKLRGTIVSFDDTQFDLSTKNKRPPQRILFEDLDDLKVTQLLYADATSRPDRARSAVRELGVDQGVKVRLLSGKTEKGRIRRTREDHFELASKQSGEILMIAYDRVERLWPITLGEPRKTSRKLHPAAKIAIGYGIFMLLIAQCELRHKTGCLP